MGSTKMIIRIKNMDKGRRHKSLLNFKLKLISEVRKHGIIWQNLNEKKNKDLLEDAWEKVKKALIIKEAGYCEKQWKLLIKNYRSHVNDVNKKLPMRTDLVTAMAFMEPQIKKTPTNGNKKNDAVDCREKKQEKMLPEPTRKSSDYTKEKCRLLLADLLHLSRKEPKPVETNVRNLIKELIEAKIEPKEFFDRLARVLNSRSNPCVVKLLETNMPSLRQSLATRELVIEGINSLAPDVASPTTLAPSTQPITATSNIQTEQVRKSSASDDGPATARSVSLAIVNHLFDSLPADAMTQVHDTLVQVLLKLRPNLESDILEVGRRQTNSRVFNPDWSGLAIPAELCQEIWKRELEKRLLSSFNAESK